MIDIIGIIIIMYFGQMSIACLLNWTSDIRDPKTFLEFLKLTFLPYMVFNYKKYSR